MNTFYPDDGCYDGGLDAFTPVRYGTDITEQQVRAYERSLQLRASQIVDLASVLTSGSVNTPLKVNVKDSPFNATGSGTTLDTLAIQAALDYVGTAGGGEVEIPAGNYLIDSARKQAAALDSYLGLEVRSNTTITCAPGTIFTVKTNASQTYACWYIGGGVSNVQLFDAKVVGDRQTHTGSGGEWGHGIYIGACTNVRIVRPRVSYCWGDGICIGSDAYAQLADTVWIEDADVANCRRNGGSLVWGKNFTLIRGFWRASSGTPPQAGFGIESDNPACVNENITFDGTTFISKEGANHALYLDGATKSIKNFKASNCTMKTQEGDVFIANASVRYPLFTQAYAIDGVATFANCYLDGPVPTCGGCVFSDCTMRLETHVFNLPVYTGDSDQPCMLNGVKIIAIGTAALVDLSGSLSEATRKVMQNCICTLDGNEAAGGSTKIWLNGFCTVTGGSFRDIGEVPPPGSYLTLIASDTRAKIDTYMDANLASGLMSTSGQLVLDRAVGRWATGTATSSSTSPNVGPAPYTVSAITGHGTQLLTSGLTVDITVTLGSGFEGAELTFVRTAASDGSGLWKIGTLKNLSTAQWCRVRYISSAWMLVASGSL